MAAIDAVPSSTASPTVELFSYYRDAELRGAMLIVRLIRLMPGDLETQLHLARHLADETRHAWLWTRRIAEIGGTPARIAAGYQSRLGQRIVPRSVPELLALTIVAEERSLIRYREHAARPGLDSATRDVLRAVIGDEQWHVAWIRDRFEHALTRDPEARRRMPSAIERYRAIEEEVYRSLAAYERERFASAGSPSPEPPREPSSAT